MRSKNVLNRRNDLHIWTLICIFLSIHWRMQKQKYANRSSIWIIYSWCEDIYPLSISLHAIRCTKLVHVTDDTRICSAPMWSLRLNRSICTLEWEKGWECCWLISCQIYNNMIKSQPDIITVTYVMHRETNSISPMRSNTRHDRA